MEIVVGLSWMHKYEFDGEGRRDVFVLLMKDDEPVGYKIGPFHTDESANRWAARYLFEAPLVLDRAFL